MCIELAKVDLKRGINEREASAYNDYKEEWPEKFIFHGAWADTNVVQVMRGDNCLNQDRSVVLILILDWLLPRQEDRFVGGSKMKTTSAIEALGPLVRFVHQQTD